MSAFLYSIFSPCFFSPTPPSLLPPTPLLSLVNTQTSQSDVNECAQDLDNCQQLCNNTVGSFTCGCEIGYELDVDGFTCALNGTTGEAVWHSILCNHIFSWYYHDSSLDCHGYIVFLSYFVRGRVLSLATMPALDYPWMVANNMAHPKYTAQS